MKRKTVTCRCNAYRFPHRWQGGKCEALKPHRFEEMAGLDEWADEYQYRMLIKDGPEFEYDYLLDS
jgi:hypothetical protein